MLNEIITRLQFLNPWLTNPDTWPDQAKQYLPPKYLPRFLPQNIFEPSFKRKIHLITGPRQCGKSTLIWHYLTQQKTPPLFILCEDRILQNWCQEPIPFLDSLQQILPEPRPLFFEEAQHLNDAGLFFKGLIDLGYAQPIWVTGSSSFHLLARTRESLAGRATRLRLLPFSLKETSSAHSHIPPALQEARIYEDFLKHLQSGGYPDAWFAESPWPILQELVHAFVIRDASDLFAIKYPDAFYKLLKLCAFDTGNLINLTQWAAICGIDRKTINNYLDILEETHIIRRVRPFLAGKRAEITRKPKIYFLDNGVRNYLTGIVSGLADAQAEEVLHRPDTGAIVENWVFTELSKNLNQNWQIHFWRSTSGAEVDFVLTGGREIIALEVKTARMTQPKISRSARSFIKAYKPKIFCVLNQNLQTKIQIEGSEVCFEIFTHLPEWLEKITAQERTFI